MVLLVTRVWVKIWGRNITQSKEDGYGGCDCLRARL
jgi:hypothetical protein